MHDTWTNLSIVARLRRRRDRSRGAGGGRCGVPAIHVRNRRTSGFAKHEPEAYSERAAGAGRTRLRRAAAPVRDAAGRADGHGRGRAADRVASNVANLLLVRGAARAKEVAIRLCVGGGRSPADPSVPHRKPAARVVRRRAGSRRSRCGARIAIMRLFCHARGAAAARCGAERAGAALHGGVSLATGIVFGLLPALRVDARRSDAGAERRCAAARARGAGPRRTCWSRRSSRSACWCSRRRRCCRARLYNLKTLDAGFTRGNLLLFTLDTLRHALARRLPRGLSMPTSLSPARPLPGVTRVSGSTSSPVHTSGNARGSDLPGSAPTTSMDRCGVHQHR